MELNYYPDHSLFENLRALDLNATPAFLEDFIYCKEYRELHYAVLRRLGKTDDKYLMPQAFAQDIYSSFGLNGKKVLEKAQNVWNKLPLKLIRLSPLTRYCFGFWGYQETCKFAKLHPCAWLLVCKEYVDDRVLQNPEDTKYQERAFLVDRILKMALYPS